MFDFIADEIKKKNCLVKSLKDSPAQTNIFESTFSIEFARQDDF